MPHPVQAGLIPAAAWIGRQVVNLAFLLGVLWFIPVVVTADPEGMVMGVCWIIAAAAAVTIVLRVLSRVERDRVPGMLGSYRADETVEMAMLPTAVAVVVELAVMGAALPYLVARADPYGVLAGALGFFGGALVVAAFRDTLSARWAPRGRRLRTAGRMLAVRLPLAILLVGAGVYAAPEPGTAASTGFILATLLFLVGAVGAAVTRVVRGEARDGVDYAADAVAERLSVAPTLRDRARLRTGLRVAVIAVPIAAVLIGWLIVTL